VSKHFSKYWAVGQATKKRRQRRIRMSPKISLERQIDYYYNFLKKIDLSLSGAALLA
jgi:hypothetical protein